MWCAFGCWRRELASPRRRTRWTASSLLRAPRCPLLPLQALVKDGKAYVQVGGGWVNDSTPEGEFQETVNKSKAMLKAVAMAESFADAS